MAGELELFLHGEDADLNAAFALDLRRPRKDESGLAEIRLTGERLHLFRRQAARVGEDCESVAFQRLLGEDVDDGVVETASCGSGWTLLDSRDLTLRFLRRMFQ